MSEVSLPPEIFGVRGRVAAGRGGREGGVLVRIRASLRKSHPLVKASRPERFEGQVVGANRGAGTLTAPRACPVFPSVRGGEHSLGTLKDAAHTRATSSTSDATTLLRLRPPGTRALQATYCDRAFDLAPGLDPLFRGLTSLPSLPAVGSASRGRPSRPRTLQGRPFIPPVFSLRP